MRIEEAHASTHRDLDAADMGMATRLLDMIGASWMSQAICVAAELEIPDRLARGSQRVEELAVATRCQPESLFRFMRALASLGICVEREDGTFGLTSMGTLLCKDACVSVRSWAIWWGRHLWPLWENLKHSVASGGSARELATGRTGYAHLETDCEASAVFNRGMLEISRVVGAAAVHAYDFSDVTRIVDVGGGYGEILRTILAAHPEMHGVLFDLPHALDGARAHFAKEDLASRVDLVSGSFFDAVPKGGDLYLLKSILHNWPDERAVAILENCRDAMASHARLVLIERVMPDRMHESIEHQALSRTDLNMLVGLGGRERTAAEISALLERAGFQPPRTFVSVTSEFSLIEATSDGG